MDTLKKSQRRRRNQRRRDALNAEFASKIGAFDEYLTWAAGELGSNIDLSAMDACAEPWERAPLHVLQRDECPSVDPQTMTDLSRAAASERSLDRAERVRTLRALCTDIWGKRGASRFAKERYRKETGETISIRTVQQYMKDTI